MIFLTNWRFFQSSRQKAIIICRVNAGPWERRQSIVCFRWFESLVIQQPAHRSFQFGAALAVDDGIEQIEHIAVVGGKILMTRGSDTFRQLLPQGQLSPGAVLRNRLERQTCPDKQGELPVGKLLS